MPKRGPLRNATPKGGSSSSSSDRKKVSAAGAGKAGKGGGGGRPFNVQWDEEVESASSSSEDDRAPKKRTKGASYDDSGDESEVEMDAEQLRRSMAHNYLKSMKADSSDEEGSSEDEEEIAERLRRERLESQGLYFRNLADGLREWDVNAIEKRILGGHELSVTCVALQSDDSTVYSGSKDNSVVRWDVETGAKTVLRPRWNRKTHPDTQASAGEVLSVAVTTDGKYVVSGGRDGLVRVYDARTNSEVKAMAGHRDAVTSLAFRRESYSLFSGSLDRCVKHWDLNEMGYIESAFGHQESIYSMDCWTKDRPISASADRTVRVWKIAEDSHLVLRGHKSSADVVRILTNETFISGGADGNLFLWKETQKKPIATVKAAHGFEGDDRLHLHNARWITSVSCVKMSDLAASGSNDGYLRLWDVKADDYEMSSVGALPCDGFINDIAMSHRLVVAGTGSEHRLGRWWHMRGPLNKVVVFRLPELESGGSVGSDGDLDEEGDEEGYDSDEVSVSDESEN